LADGSTVVRLLDGAGELAVSGQAGDLVSLLPLTPTVSGVTTHGLAYALDDEALHQGPARGLSNVMTGTTASVRARDGRLLIVHTRSDR
jgi:thiamine pyrophosphokinase